RRLGRQLIGHQHLPGPELAPIEGCDLDVDELLAAGADHRQSLPIWRKGRLRAVVLWRSQRLSDRSRSGGEVDLAQDPARLSVEGVLRVEHGAGRERNRLNISACEVLR